ncbi:hypothetical protein CDN98_00045 [Roseateles terrae]|nr:hypothetical protein CDN98_00045 [Roseateles terrae]
MLSLTHSADVHGSSNALRRFTWRGAAILDACSVEATADTLVVLTAEGALWQVDLAAVSSTQLCSLELPALPVDERQGVFGVPQHRLYASHDGAYVAVVSDLGTQGQVINTRTGQRTLLLNGGDYHPDTVPFSACFVRWNERDLLVHRTAWNRLDVSDPATGVCLTDRQIEPRNADGDWPPHHLDYFHGALFPSPSGGRLLDDGWVWQPLSIPRIWSVNAWLSSNPWESEDGTSVIDVCQRDMWTIPVCWINDDRLAFWGTLDWDDEEGESARKGQGVQLVQLMDTTAQHEGWWPMPEIGDVTAVFSDGRHLHLAAKSGTTVWCLSTREQVAVHPNFTARLFDRTRRVLIAFDGDSIEALSVAHL